MAMRFLRPLVASAVAAFLLAAIPAAHAVVGGEPDTAHPYVVFAGQMQPPPRNACSAVLIAPRLAVTAAHCGFLPSGSVPNGQPFVVLHGANVMRAPDAGSPAAFFRMSGFSWGGNGLTHFARNDVAVLRLAAPMPGPYAQLPEVGIAVKPGTPLQVVGYGVSEIDGNDPVVSSFDGTRRRDDARLLGGGPDGFLHFAGGAYLGDSGGGVLLGDTVLGIVSFAPSAGRSTNYAVDLRDPEVNAFIRSHLG